MNKMPLTNNTDPFGVAHRTPKRKNGTRDLGDPLLPVVIEPMVVEDSTPEDQVKTWMRTRYTSGQPDNNIMTADMLAEDAIAHYIGFEWADEVESNGLKWATEVIAEYNTGLVGGALTAPSVRRYSGSGELENAISRITIGLLFNYDGVVPEIYSQTLEAAVHPAIASDYPQLLAEYEAMPTYERYEEIRQNIANWNSDNGYREAQKPSNRRHSQRAQVGATFPNRSVTFGVQQPPYSLPPARQTGRGRRVDYANTHSPFNGLADLKADIIQWIKSTGQQYDRPDNVTWQVENVYQADLDQFHVPTTVVWNWVIEAQTGSYGGRQPHRSMGRRDAPGTVTDTAVLQAAVNTWLTIHLPDYTSGDTYDTAKMAADATEAFMLQGDDPDGDGIPDVALQWAQSLVTSITGATATITAGEAATTQPAPAATNPPVQGAMNYRRSGRRGYNPMNVVPVYTHQEIVDKAIELWKTSMSEDEIWATLTQLFPVMENVAIDASDEAFNYLKDLGYIDVSTGNYVGPRTAPRRRR